MPRLSIGLPVYNGERYLAASIESLLAQDWADFELIISDNASTDATLDIAHQFAGADARVRVVQQRSNVGAARNFNVVLREASAPYFKWACADDCLCPGFLRSAIAELEAHPEAVLCYGGSTLVDADGRSLGTFDQRLNLRQQDVAARFTIAWQRLGLLNVLQGVMRRDALNDTRRMRAFPGSDEALLVELALRGTILEIDAPMLMRRMHPMAQSASSTMEDRYDHLDPQRSERLFLPRWTRLLVALQAVAEAPLPAGTRVKLSARVIRSMISERDTLLSELVRAGQKRFRRLSVGGRSAAL